ncbi:MAG: glycosyltransferase family 2 protein [Clostridia bacterium]|nr:glycosyltransferase family 2 protein [Clostridia bacterium]
MEIGMYSLIIVDYNSLNNTIKYVLSCKEKLGKVGSSHIVILQNGEFDGTLEELTSFFGEYEICQIDGIEQTTYKFRNDFQEIYYCCSGANLGYAKGNNIAIRIAESIWSDPYYIVSNNDLVFKNKIDLSLVSKVFDENASVGVIGPAVITPKDESQSPRYWQSAVHRLIFNYWISAFGGIFGSKTRMHLLNKYANDTLKNAESGLCDWVSGCFMFIRAKAFKQAGMFDENTFLYAEEMILTKRLQQVGYNIYYLKEIGVIHNHAETTKKTISQLKMSEIDFYANYYFYKNYVNTSPIILFLAKLSFKLLKCCIYLKGIITNNR